MKITNPRLTSTLSNPDEICIWYRRHSKNSQSNSLQSLPKHPHPLYRVKWKVNSFHHPEVGKDLAPQHSSNYFSLEALLAPLDLPTNEITTRNLLFIAPLRPVTVNMSTFRGLPNEILLNIIENLRFEDIESVTLSCKHIRGLALRILNQHLSRKHLFTTVAIGQTEVCN